MPNNRWILCACIVILASWKPSFAKKKLRIEAKIANIKPMRLILAQYFAGQQMPVDTAMLGADGRVVWQTDAIPEGVCRIVGLGRGLDIFVTGTQQFSFEADYKDLIASIRFKNSPENTLFFDYQRELRRRYQSALAERQRMGVKEDSDPRWKNRFQELNQQVKDFVDSLYQKHPTYLSTRFLKSYQEPNLPILPVQKLSAKDSLYLRNYAWEHFFDNAFLFDERMVYTSTVPARFDRFLKALPQFEKEHRRKLVEGLIQKTKGTTELRKYIIGGLAQRVELTSNPDFDQLFGQIVDNYVENDTKLWDASTLQRLKELKSIKANVAIGNAFPKIPLSTVDGKALHWEDIHSDYTLLFFYDPGCTHCREATPALVTMAKQYANKMKVVAITLDPNEAQWKAFINQFQTENFVNVRDAARSIEFYKLGVIEYPTIYLLDRDKKIVGRWLKVEELPSYLVSR